MRTAVRQARPGGVQVPEHLHPQVAFTPDTEREKQGQYHIAKRVASDADRPKGTA